MTRRIFRLVLAAFTLSPASAFIAHQYRTDDKPTPTEVATRGTEAVTTTTTPTPPTPTTLITATPATKDFARLNYPAFGIGFARPKRWRAQTFPGQTSGPSTAIVYLSGDQLIDPCDSLEPGTTECGWPIEAISPNTPLVIWTLRLDAPKFPSNTLISGQLARVDSAKPGACRAVQAQETIVAAIARPAGGVFYMRACLSGDQLAMAEQNVYAMLASVKVS